jgi:O-antigen ligase
VKWVGLIIVLAAVVPVSWWLRHHPYQTPKVSFLLGFLPFVFVPLHLFMAGVSWTDWPGFVHGFEFSVLDGLVIAVWFSTPRGVQPLPFKFSMTLYFLAVLLSTLQARTPIAALFYPWQLGRMFVVYVTVTRWVSADQRVAPALLKGMAAGLFLEAGIAIWQRFGLGLLQPEGTFDTQNLLGVISHFVTFPFFALLLRGSPELLPALVVFAAIVVEALTTSRATIGLAGFGFIILFFLSAVRKWTTRKMLILLTGAAMTTMVAPLALSSFEQRQFVNSEITSDTDRESFIRAAVTMFSDHPLGIGSNHYVSVANSEGYNQNAGVQPNSRGSIVHNVYWLVASETGWLGLITFLLLLLGPLIAAFSCGWRNRVDKRGDLLIGIGVGLLIVYIHSFFEWIFVLSETQYMFAMQVGLVAGLAQQLGYWPTRATVKGSKHVRRVARRHGVSRPRP